MDLNALVPDLSHLLGISPATLLLLFIVIPKAAKAIGRAIPDDAKGFAGFIRQLCAIVGVDVANRISSGVTTDQAALVAAKTRPISDKIEAQTGVDLAPMNTETH